MSEEGIDIAQGGDRGEGEMPGERRGENMV